MSEADFQGLDEATVEDRHPKIPPNTTGVGKVVAAKAISGQYGKTFVIEQEIVESDNEDCKVGGTYTVTITDYAGRNAKLKLGKIKNFLASVFQVDPLSEQKWGGIAAQCSDNGAANGRMVRFQTSPEAVAKDSGKPYVSCVYSPYEG
jgi:hypothetical protein